VSTPLRPPPPPITTTHTHTCIMLMPQWARCLLRSGSVTMSFSSPDDQQHSTARHSTTRQKISDIRYHTPVAFACVVPSVWSSAAHVRCALQDQKQARDDRCRHKAGQAHRPGVPYMCSTVAAPAPMTMDSGNCAKSTCRSL
jgi:hypothetical protein